MFSHLVPAPLWEWKTLLAMQISSVCRGKGTALACRRLRLDPRTTVLGYLLSSRTEFHYRTSVIQCPVTTRTADVSTTNKKRTETKIAQIVYVLKYFTNSNCYLWTCKMLFWLLLKLPPVGGGGEKLCVVKFNCHCKCPTLLKNEPCRIAVPWPDRLFWMLVPSLLNSNMNSAERSLERAEHLSLRRYTALFCKYVVG